MGALPGAAQAKAGLDCKAQIAKALANESHPVLAPSAAGRPSFEHELD